MAVIIGVDPHKASHTAAAIDDNEQVLGELRVRSAAGQVELLVGWAESFGDRTWAVEGAGGVGYLLAQQLVAAGESVVDVQPKLAARVRLLASGNTNKNDPNDARCVAIAALRSPTPKVVVAEDHAAVMKVWAKRHRDLGRHRTRMACRLHAVLCELVPGGVAGEISAGQAAQLLDTVDPRGAIETARHELALEFVEDLARIDAQMRATKKRITAVVTASETTTVEIFGVGPIVAATVIGDVGDISRFATRDSFAAYNGTAPIEVSSGPRKIYRLSRRGNRRLNHAIHVAAVTQIRHRHSVGRAYYDRKLAEGKTGKEAIRALKRRISDALYQKLQVDAERARKAHEKGPGGQTGNDSKTSATGSHPESRLFGEATPGPQPSLRRTAADHRPRKAPTPVRTTKKAS